MTKRKKWAIALMIGGVILMVIAIFGGSSDKNGAKSAKEKEIRPVAPVVLTDSGKKYAAAYNWSKDTGKFFSKEIAVPEGNQGWVSIAVPPYGRIETSRTFDIEYEIGEKETVKEGPNLPRVEAKAIPAIFEVRALGKGGTLKIWFHLDPTPEVKKEAKKVSSKRVRMSRKNLTNVDVPHSVQIM